MPAALGLALVRLKQRLLAYDSPHNIRAVIAEDKHERQWRRRGLWPLITRGPTGAKGLPAAMHGRRAITLKGCSQLEQTQAGACDQGCVRIERR
jgi:hypothetical protein